MKIYCVVQRLQVTQVYGKVCSHLRACRMWQCCDSTSMTGETKIQIDKVLDVSDGMTV